jgi:hypothetical protein
MGHLADARGRGRRASSHRHRVTAREENGIALAIYVHPKEMTRSRFEEIHRHLADAGASEHGADCITRGSAPTAT